MRSRPGKAGEGRLHKTPLPSLLKCSPRSCQFVLLPPFECRLSVVYFMYPGLHLSRTVQHAGARGLEAHINHDWQKLRCVVKSLLHLDKILHRNYSASNSFVSYPFCPDKPHAFQRLDLPWNHCWLSMWTSFIFRSSFCPALTSITGFYAVTQCMLYVQEWVPWWTCRRIWKSSSRYVRLCASTKRQT